MQYSINYSYYAIYYTHMNHLFYNWEFVPIFLDFIYLFLEGKEGRKGKKHQCEREA